MVTAVKSVPNLPSFVRTCVQSSTAGVSMTSVIKWTTPLVADTSVLLILLPFTVKKPCQQKNTTIYRGDGINCSDAGTRGARGATGSPIFVRLVNPIGTGEGRLSPPITTGTPKVFHLPASLKWRILSQPTKIGSGKNKKSLFCF